MSQLKKRHKGDRFRITFKFDEQSMRKLYQKKYDDLISLAELADDADGVSLEECDDLINSAELADDADEVSLEEYNDLICHADLADEMKDEVPLLYIAPNDIHRAISNILDNARKHGFTDPSRKDYEVKVRLSIDEERNMFQIDFCNNGNPLPEGMDKMRYGIKGEKAGKNAGTGIGGSYIKKFVDHYGGDYDVFMDNGWTVVRICLPIK